jgi:hypothetical protein
MGRKTMTGERMSDTDPRKLRENMVNNMAGRVDMASDAMSSMRDALLEEYAAYEVARLIRDFGNNSDTRSIENQFIYMATAYQVLPNRPGVRVDERIKRVQDLLRLTAEDTEALAAKFTKALRSAGYRTIEAQAIRGTSLIKFRFASR